MQLGFLFSTLKTVFVARFSEINKRGGSNKACSWGNFLKNQQQLYAYGRLQSTQYVMYTIGKIHFVPNLIKKKMLEFEIFSGLANSVNWNDLQELFNPFGQGMKPDVKMHYSTSGLFMGSAEGLLLIRQFHEFCKYESTNFFNENECCY